jgi:DNA-binding NarL/FixJ family response regulator
MTRMTDHELDQHLRRTVRAVAATVEDGANGCEPIRVLVVDDQELFRRGLVMLLGLEPGIEVVGEARDGVEGTNFAASDAPDVVLLDVRMPRRSGIEACLAIKDAVPSAKILMLTASDEEADLY